jgi:radical SAM protein with 4Fe4S-binding SPASM domain
MKKLAVRALDSRLITGNPLYRWAYERQVKQIMKICEEKPLQVMIENTNACNLKCIHCPHKNMKREIGFMDMSLYKRIIDECIKLGISQIDIHQFGEPLLDPLFIDRVRYAKVKGIKLVTTNTNGLLLTKDKAKELIKTGIDQIIISIDAATSKTYDIVRPPGDLEIVKKNVKNLIKIRNITNSKGPRIVVDHVEMPENVHETKLFIKKWKDVADSVCVSYAHTWLKSVDKAPTGLHGSEIREPCRLLWTNMVIAWDGKVPLCCVDYECEHIIDDVWKKSIKEIWSGEKMQKIRSAHLQRKFDEVSPCNRCDYRSTWWVV